ncbi:MAG: twin-arginine translocation pathway signal [Candidatus Kapaibacterium sp.]|nr:MAG: twin-arginine translocation pathway signal [Candidatus Kapabacteria bacterium]
MIFTGMLLERFVIAAPRYTGPKSDHFDGERFFNPEHPKETGIGDLIRWQMTAERGEWQAERVNTATSKPEIRLNAVKNRVTFINHSTALIQTGGINILTDPVWSDYVGVFDRIGPKRVRPAGVKESDLPPIDVILLSHNHYDHLDISTMKRLADRFKPVIVVPLGIKAFLEQEGIRCTIIEMDWWQAHTYTHSSTHTSTSQSDSSANAPAKLEITCVPAQHFSGRGVSDRAGTLWCGFVAKNLQTADEIYFAGDSGYGGHFKKIGERFHNITLALIPIGAFRPRWFMSPVHIAPDEAVKVHQDVHSRQSIGIHFGTFPLADDGEHEPLQELQKALQQANITPSAFQALDFGGHLDF